MLEADSTSANIREMADVGVDRTIEERVMADAREGEGENLLREGGGQGDLRGVGVVAGAFWVGSA